MFSHITLGTHDLERAIAFHDTTLAPLGIERVDKKYPKWAAWQRPSETAKLWVGLPYNQQQASAGNGSMVALRHHPPAPWMRPTRPPSRQALATKALQGRGQAMAPTTTALMCATPMATSCTLSTAARSD